MLGVLANAKRNHEIWKKEKNNFKKWVKRNMIKEYSYNREQGQHDALNKK